MSAARLIARRKDGVVVAVLERTAVATTIVSATERVRPDLERWLRGLYEFVGSPGDQRPRKTLPGDPSLLDRVAERFRGYGFETIILATGVSAADDQWRDARRPEVHAGIRTRSRSREAPETRFSLHESRVT
jgi:hypothetical protein